MKSKLKFQNNMNDAFKYKREFNYLIKTIGLCKRGKLKEARKKLNNFKSKDVFKKYYLNILYSINSHNNLIKDAQKNCQELAKNFKTSFSYNLLGNFHKFKKNYKLAEICYNKSIKLNPKINKTLIDIKNYRKDIKKYIKVEKKFNIEKLEFTTLEFILKMNLSQLVTISRPHFAKGYTNIENLLNQLSNLKKFSKSRSKNLLLIKKIDFLLKKNIKNFLISPDYDNPYFNLGTINDKTFNYKKAANWFLKSNLFEKNERYNKNILEVLYKDNNKKKFINHIKKFKKRRVRDFSAYAISNFASNQWNIKNYYQFCDEPMNFIYNENLINKKIISKKFVKSLEKVIINFSNHTKTPVVIGYKSLGNLIEIKNKRILEFKKIIVSRLLNYRKNFSNSQSEMIKNWPKKFGINAWYIKLKKGGEVTSHIHHGWISGVFYIKKQSLNTKDLEISYKYKNLPSFKKKYPKINLKTDEGRLILFPSSLPHRVLPYADGKTERISIAFDMVPH